MKELVFDLETNGLFPEVDHIWMLGIGDIQAGTCTIYADRPGYPALDIGIKELQSADRIIGHNIMAYDIPVLEKVYGEGVVDRTKAYDTMVVSRMVNPDLKTHSLKAWGETLGFPKGEYDLGFEEWHDEMVPYCEQDLRVTGRVYKIVSPKVADAPDAVALEMEFQYIIGLQERNGFLLDVTKAEALEAELRDEVEKIEQRLQEVFPPIVTDMKTPQYYFFMGKPDIRYSTKSEVVPASARKALVDGPLRTKTTPFNPGSRQMFADRMKEKYDWVPTAFTPGGQAQIDEGVLSEMTEYPEAVEMARYLRVSKELGQLSDGKNGWLKLVKPDDRVYGRMNTIGARTHRCSHFTPNMGQVDKKDIRMREVWIPRKGWKLVGADGSGLELRMLAHYLFRYDQGVYAKAVVEGKSADGTDAHSRTLKLVGLFIRDNAKTLIYAYLYGAGNPKLGSVIFEDADQAGKPRPKGKGPAIGNRARGRLLAGITGLKKLQDAVQKKTKRDGYIKGLDGRLIKSPAAYSALNTLLQSAGAVVMKKALVIFHAEVTAAYPHGERWAYCANVHDEIQVECDPELAEYLGQAFAKACRLAGEQLGVKCPLDGAYLIGNNWAETH